jgi:hypothetical protein
LQQVATVVSACLFVLAILLLGWTSFCWFMSSASTMFHRVTGEVILSDVTGHQGTRSYRKIFRYRYNIDGATYQADTIRFGANDETEMKAFGAGKSVSVYYDPQNPAIACLKPGVYSGIYWGMAKVALLSVLALLFFCFGKYYLASSS